MSIDTYSVVFETSTAATAPLGALQWRHNERDGVSNHQPHDCLLNRVFGRKSNKSSKLRVTGLCEENPLVTGEFPAQRASNAENVVIWWCHHHDVQFSCAINQPLLAHHWRVHQCLLTSRFIAPSIPWGVSAPGGKMLKQLLKDHNFLNNSPIFIIESSTFNTFAFQKALHSIHFKLKHCFGFSERYLTP